MKFYETKWFAWVTLIFFAPIGIFVLWKYKHYGKGASVALTLIFSIVFLAALGSNTDTTKKDSLNEKSTVSSEVSNTPEIETNTTEAEKTTEPKPTPTVTPTPTAPAEPIELGSGNFVSGEDFPEGKYDIVWVSGYGNVSSSNLFNGGINAIMGEGTNGEKEYKNIRLPKGTELKISSVKVKLIPK